jgi:hypothetical protein
MPRPWERGLEVPEFTKTEEQADRIDRAIREGSRGLSTNIEQRIGICASCSNFDYAENDVHVIVRAQCSGFSWEKPQSMSGRQKISRCSKFMVKGQMGIEEMYGMATLIDPGQFTSKRKLAGFTSEELTNEKVKRNDGGDCK